MRQADTAIASYRALEHSLGDRQAFVRQLLREFRDRYATWPTATELLRYATATHEACQRFDPNSIRPRLFELDAQGFVAKGPKRVCAISGKRVYTWILTTPVVPAFGALEHARQVELL